MKSELKGGYYEVLVTNADLIKFADQFPCHGLDLDAEYVFLFDARNGDLVEMSALRDGMIPDCVTEEENGAGLVALGEDAGLTGAEQLGLQDVLAMKYTGALLV